jgi:hypothetical protein
MQYEFNNGSMRQVLKLVFLGVHAAEAEVGAGVWGGGQVPHRGPKA